MAELEGFDYSKWNAGRLIGSGGKRFGLAKATEGIGYLDPGLDGRCADMERYLDVWGLYHFARPDLNPGQAGAYGEADWFWARATAFRPGALGILLCNDLETGDGVLGGWRDDFCGRLAWRAGSSAWAWWYSFDSFVRRHALNTSGTPYPYWAAWPDANGPLPTYNFGRPPMQQYGLTSVPGIAGPVDANRYFGDLSSLRALTVGGASTPVTGDSSMASGSSITIDGLLIVAVVAKDGSIALAASSGGLGGLQGGTYLGISAISSDTRDVWLGQDIDGAGVKRLLVFTVDGEGTVYSTAIVPGEWDKNTGWVVAAGMRQLVRPPMYEGQPLPVGEPGPTGPEGPPGPGSSEDQVRTWAADEVVVRMLRA